MPSSTLKPDELPPRQPRRKIVLDGRYELGDKLGKGGFGSVYEAQDLQFAGLSDSRKSQVAVKLATEILSPRAFKREALMMAQVASPNVVKVLAYGEEEIGGVGQHYIVMERLWGDPVDDMIKQEPDGLPDKLLYRLAKEIGRALGVVHGDGLIHRDLKPSNILHADYVNDEGEHDRKFVLIDFGISSKRDASSETMRGGTVAGFGTPEYMPPELFGKDDAGEQNEATVASDVYAFAVVLYEAMTGRKPFEVEGETMLDMANLVQKIVKEPPPPPSQLAPARGIDPRVDKLLLSCLEKDPAKRPASADKVSKEFCLLLKPEILRHTSSTGLDSTIVGYHPVSPRRRFLGTALSVAVAAAAAGGAAYFMQSGGPDSEPTVTPVGRDYADGRLDVTAGEESVVRIKVSGGPDVQIRSCDVTSSDQDLTYKLVELPGEREIDVLPALNLPSGEYVLRVETTLEVGGNALPAETQEIKVRVSPPEVWLPPAPAAGRFEPMLGELERHDGRVLPEQIRLYPNGVSENRPVVFHRISSKHAPEGFKPVYLATEKVSRDLYQLWPDRIAESPDVVDAMLADGATIDDDRLPQIAVGFEAATSFAEWFAGPSGALPDVLEWQVAAGCFEPNRGEGPYSDVSGSSDDEIYHDEIGPIRSPQFESDVSPFGIREMAVNGWEMSRKEGVDTERYVYCLRPRREYDGRLKYVDFEDMSFLTTKNVTSRDLLDYGFRVAIVPGRGE